MDYESMSIEELEAENTRLSNERARIQAEQRTINDVLSRKFALRDAQIKLNGMSEAERAAFTQLVGVQVGAVKAAAKKAGE